MQGKENRRPWLSRLVMALAVSMASTAGWLALTPVPAQAHSVLLGTSPADAATVTGVTSEVTLTFNEIVKARFSTIVVTGPEGANYSDGTLQVIDNIVHQAVYPLRSGSYQVAWRVVSADGHPVSGSFGFTVALPAALEPTAGPPSPTATAQGGGDAGGRGWWWAGGAVAVLAAVAALGVRLVRRRLP